jgi:hypothetical protein
MGQVLQQPYSIKFLRITFRKIAKRICTIYLKDQKLAEITSLKPGKSATLFGLQPTMMPR